MTFLQHHKRIAKEIQYLNKQDTAILTKILIGHNNLNRHSFRAKLADSPNCDYCKDNEENETAMHILLDCAAFTEERQYTFGNPILSLEELLKNKDTKKHITKNIMKFLTESETLLKKRLSSLPKTLKTPRASHKHSQLWPVSAKRQTRDCKYHSIKTTTKINLS